MAKSRLLDAVKTQRGKLENEMDAFIKKCFGGQVSLDDVRELQKALIEFEKAIDDMDTHMKNLERRENTPKVADRLRNLKNIFKDKQALSHSRTLTAAAFAQIKRDTAELRGQVHAEIEDITGALMGLGH